MSIIKPCPACESDDTDLSESVFTRKRSRFCRACGVGGPSADSKAEADAAWNALPRRGDGLAWRSEPPDRPGFWLCWKTIASVRSIAVEIVHNDASVEYLRDVTGMLWFGPIPKPPAPDAEKEEPL